MGIGTANPGVILASQALGRMSTSNELLVKARRLRGTPILDAPTSWQYLVWKLEYDAAQAEEIDGLAALAADQLLKAPKLRDIPQSIKELAGETSKLKRSPVGMLFKLSRGGG